MKKKINNFLICCLYLVILSLGPVGCSIEFLSDHIQDDDPDTYGLWEVGHTSFTVFDSSRDNRRLLVDAWYPVDDEDVRGGLLSSYPLLGPLGLTAEIAMLGKPVSHETGRKLIIFSHGYGGPNTQSTPLMENLASHGFIVASPAHTGNTVNSNPEDDYDTAGANRVPDVSFVIDSMFIRNNIPADMFYGRIDETSVGVVGHSFGGATSLGMAAGWGDSLPDPRVSAIAPISAVVDAERQGDTRTGPYAGFDEEQLSEITVPVMLIGGTEDTSVHIENNELAYAWIPGTVYRADILGANHTHFANVCDIGNFLTDLNINMNLWSFMGAEKLIQPYLDTCTEGAFPIDEVIRLQNLYVTAFFKRHLQGHMEYDEYLTEAYALHNEPNIEFYSK